VDLSLIGSRFLGESIAAPTICAGKSAGHSVAREAGHQHTGERRLPQPTSSFVNSICSLESPVARWLRVRTALQLTQVLAKGGGTSMLDSGRRSQLVVHRGRHDPDLERRIEQQENFISTLLGNNPGPIARGAKFHRQPHTPEVPPGLPSSLLERAPTFVRPMRNDRGYAQIGVAKAAYFRKSA